jgi:hypothetical protein
MTGMPGQSVQSSIRDELSSAFDGGDPTELEGAPVEGAPPGGELEAPGVPVELPALEAPNQWDKPYRDVFGKFAANPEYRDLLSNWKDQWKSQEGVLTKKSQEYADYRRSIEPIMQVIAPYEQYWGQQGLDKVAGVRQVFSYAQALAQDPGATLMQLANMYGVDLNELIQGQPYVDPEVSNLKQTVQQLQQQLGQVGNREQEAVRNRVLSEVQAFAEAKDAAGNLQYPYFDRVIDKMTGLAQAKMAQTLGEAYEMALRLDPEVQAEIAAATQQQEAAARAAAAKKALGASQTVQGKSTENVPPSKSLRDELGDAFEQAGFR